MLKTNTLRKIIVYEYMATLGNFSVFFFFNYSMILVVQTHFKVHMDVVENSGKRVIDA